MDTLICAGGSGSRVLEAVLHLCAAGLGPQKLRILVIDPDVTNGNLGRTGKLVDTYQELHKLFGERQTAGEFFATELDLISANKLQNWSPVQKGQLFKQVLNLNQLSNEQRGNNLQKDVVRLLFSQDELDMQMDVGFRGHPALGAAALSLLPLYKQDPLWSSFCTTLQSELPTAPKIVIAGSIFGGTGASAIHPLVRFLRAQMQNDARLKIGAVALAPYFQFAPDKNDPAQQQTNGKNAARSELFPLASRAAAQYYEHLKLTNDWDFDAMYWVGNDAEQTVKFAVGAELQKNPAHFVDLLAALACLDFFTHAATANGECRYCGPETATDAGPNVIAWGDLPISEGILQYDRAEFCRRWHTFHMSAVAHLGFNSELLQSDKLKTMPYCVPWYAHCFPAANDNLSSESNSKALAALAKYWKEDYLGWCDEIHFNNPYVQLFNPAVWGSNPPNISKLSNLRFPGNSEAERDTLDRLFTLMVYHSNHPNSIQNTQNAPMRYLRLLANATRNLVQEIEQRQPA